MFTSASPHRVNREAEGDWRKVPRGAGQCLRPAHLPQPPHLNNTWSTFRFTSAGEMRVFSPCALRCYLKKQAKDSKPGLYGLPQWFWGKELACQCRRRKRRAFDHRIKEIPWRRAWQPHQCSCLENPMDGGAWQSMELGRVRHNWSGCAFLFCIPDYDLYEMY